MGPADSHPILVTGSTGNAGREVVRALLARGEAVRAAGTRPTVIRDRFGDAVEPVHLDFRDPSTFDAAAAGCRALFLLRPPPISKVGPTLNRFVDAARASGVGQVVFLSVAGAEQNRMVPHHGVETHLQERGGDYTILRPGFFAQNLQDAYCRDIVEDRRIYVPAGRARVAFVDLRDVAQVAASALLDPAPHRGQGYTLTGPAAHSFEEVAQSLTRETQTEIAYVPASWPGYMWHLRTRGLPMPQILVQTVLHVGLRFGQAEEIDPTLERLLGVPARTVVDYIRDHRDRWASPQ